MRAPVGAVVGMYYDADIGDELAIGHALQTPTGRTYVVLELRVQARGKHAGRYHRPTRRCTSSSGIRAARTCDRPVHG